ncbi:hypothetical protein GH714_027084 [Hevea brasiliensis]|uniref:Flavodoxin-like domain-containing protein n=1 Tax=Hevea brasiliensis TaxID=3981 RepID=A0A6A6NB73_HEVBR|nr:hypothetical protein GH714_027084 [Hevea brasiliensis]
MGKGGGCVPSKNKRPAIAEDHQGSSLDAPIPVEDNAENNATAAMDSTSQLKIFIVFYSMYGHVEGLARRMKKGVDGVEGVQAVLYRVPETLLGDVLEHMKAPAKDPEIPEITAAELADADGFYLGFQREYSDVTYRGQAMAVNFVAAFFTYQDVFKYCHKQLNLSCSYEIHISVLKSLSFVLIIDKWTAITQLAHHGMLFVPVGYTFGAGMFKMDSIRGGSPYGAGVYAGDGSREPSESELALAEHHGKYMATVVKKLAQA